jgi:predicted NUDIX family NTP pyrophosphohydrolase
LADEELGIAVSEPVVLAGNNKHLANKISVQLYGVEVK